MFKHMYMSLQRWDRFFRPRLLPCQKLFGREDTMIYKRKRKERKKKEERKKERDKQASSLSEEKPIRHSSLNTLFRLDLIHEYSFVL